MNWVTLYIKGKSDFREEVRRKLRHSELNFMPGYMEGSDANTVSDMYWIDERIKLRDVKEAIGGKLIWKYRLRFFTTLETYLQSEQRPDNSTTFTDDEMNMIEEMRDLVYR